MAKKKNTAFKSVDKLSKELDIVDSFVLKNWKRYVYIACAIIVVFAVGLYIYEHRSRVSLAQSQEIFTAKTAGELEQVISKYPDADAINFSRLELASILFDQKDYQKAKEVYQDEINKGNSAYAVSLAKLNSNYILEAMGKKKEAARGFEQISQDKAIPDYIRAEAAYSAGRLYIELGDKPKGVKSLEVCQSFKDVSGWQKFAKGLIDQNV